MATNPILHKLGSAVSLYKQAKALGTPDESLGSSLRVKGENVREYTDETRSQRLPVIQIAEDSSNKINPKARYGDKSGEERIDTSNMLRPLGTYKSGTDYVPVTGPYILHEGEKVTPAEENPEAQVSADGEAHPDDIYEPKPVQEASLVPLGTTGGNGAGERQTEEEKRLRDKQAGLGKISSPGAQPEATEKPKVGPPTTGQTERASIMHDDSSLKTLGGKPPIDNNAVAQPPATGKEAAPAPPVANATPNAKLALQRAEIHKQMEDAAAKGDLVALGSAKLHLLELNKLNPYGSEANHPGILGKIAHGLAKAGNIAGDILAPGVMANIEGTDLNKQLQENEAVQNINQGTENVLRTAQADKAAKEPAVKPQDQLAQNKLDAQNRLKEITVALQDPTLDPAAKAKLEQERETIFATDKELRPTVENTQNQPVGDAGVQQHNAALDTMIAGMAPEEAQKFKAAYGVNAKDALGTQQKRLDDARATQQMNASERDRALQRDLSAKQHAESMAAIAANRASAEEHKDKAEQIKSRQEVAKIYETSLTSAERYNIMTKNAQDAIRTHDQQAMLSLLANHLGMTMGLQKGARLNQAIINEAAKSQPWIAGIKAKFDKDGYLSGLTLGPEQMKSMVSLARERYHEDVVAARNKAQYAGAEDDGPARTPSTSTIHYYLELAGATGKPTPEQIDKAKQLANEDGWTVETGPKVGPKEKK